MPRGARAVGGRRVVLVPLVSAVALAAGGATAAGQTIQGRVLDDQNDRPIPTALVRLVAADGGERGITAADSSGVYRIVAPEPGVYRLVAERIGYEDFETPLLEAGREDGVYSLDLLMRRAPIPIRGIEVTAAEADREIQLMIGLSPRSLRRQPIHRETIVGHIERAHDLTDLVRWQNAPGIVVRETTDGPCYESVRRRRCIPVYLNGFPMQRGIVPVIPLEMVHAIVVLYPNESIQYPGGAVLLYTEAWLR